jgi:CMP-2-keto-3-deoxyoctulosonic acid synthetase
MVIRVVEKTMQIKSLHDVIVLTDDERTLNTINDAGYKAVMTSEHYASGIYRIAEYMKKV